MSIVIRIESCRDCAHCKNGYNRSLHGDAAACDVNGRDLPYIVKPKFGPLARKIGVKATKEEATYVTPDWCPLRIKDVAAFKAIA